MAKTPKLPKKEDEYKFSEIDEGPPHLGPERPPRRQLPAIFRSRKLWLAIGIIAAIAIVYQFIGKTPRVNEGVTELEAQKPLAAAPPTPAQQVPQVPSTQVLPTLPPVQPAVPLPVQPAVPLPAQPTVPQVGVTQPAVTAVPTAVNVGNVVGVQPPKLNVGNIGGAQPQNLQQVQTNVQQLQTSVTQLGNQVSNLKSCLPRSCVIPPQVIPTTQPVRVVAVRKIYLPRPHYQVRAVVPGRAWLQEKRNRFIYHLITVKVGDFLPGYGRVQAINSRQGKVFTSWGNVIYPDDGITD